MPDQLRRSDFGWIFFFCLVLYTLVLTAGGPLTMHEGVLSQTSRQMLADHDWVIPHFGTAPWLERPPLPQWLTVAIATLIGHCDEEWIVRIGPALSGTITALLAAWLGGVLFGRAAGVISGLVLATMYQFVRYSTLAEADMFLTPIVAGCVCLFAYLELVRGKATTDSQGASPLPPASLPSSTNGHESVGFFGTRPWPVLALFVLLGMTNLAKGLAFGTVMALVPIGGYLLWSRELRPILRYCWLWGWLTFVAVALAWPLLVYRRYPDVLELWHFDLFARLTGNYMQEPRWYYFANWFWVVVPWPLAGLTGLYFALRPAFAQGHRGYRLLLCWAVLTPLVFSYARGKHHHYMIHFLAPWGILASPALVWLWQKAQNWPSWLRQPVAGPVLLGLLADVGIGLTPPLPGPSWIKPLLLVVVPLALALWWGVSFQRRGQFALVSSFGVVLVFYWLAFTYKSHYLHRSAHDTAFLRAAFDQVPTNETLLLHPGEEALEALRTLFYCPAEVSVLHNLSFLRGDELPASVFVIARGKEMPNLARYGQPSLLLQSEMSRREDDAFRHGDTPAGYRWALFHVQLRDDLTRRSAKVRFTPMQAMFRAEGPSLE